MHQNKKFVIHNNEFRSLIAAQKYGANSGKERMAKNQCVWKNVSALLVSHERRNVSGHWKEKKPRHL